MIGDPVPRIDAPKKVTGTATYTAEVWDAGQPLYGWIVGAAIGHGRIARLDTARAEAAPGVQLVWTHRNAPRQHEPDAGQSSYARARPVLTSAEIRHHGEAVALVVATTLEEARAAAALVDVAYEAADGHFDLAAREAHAVEPPMVQSGLFATRSKLGDVDAAMAAAPVTIDRRYTTPYELAQPMEPPACFAAWKGDQVTVHTSTQIIAAARARIAQTLGIPMEKVKVVARYVGGGFGSKLGVQAETILAVLAARALAKPVKIALSRQQMFQLVSQRPASRQRVRLAAGRDGLLTAFAHEATIQQAYGSDFVEQTAACGRPLYAAANRFTTHRVVSLHLPPGGDVRAPGEATGLLAIESAMDELAHALGLDPVELRVRNEPPRDPESNVPFSQRRLVECLQEGARRFGWQRRRATPATLRDAHGWIGYGMASAIRTHFQLATSVRVRLGPSGAAVVQSDMTDIGTGTYTILAQTVGEALGISHHDVRVELGDSDFPTSAGSGGSFGAANSCNAAFRACRALRARLAAAAVADPLSPMHGLDPAGATLADGRLAIGHASEPVADLVTRLFPSGVDATGDVADGTAEPSYKAYALNTYGAHFAEVRVDAVTGEVRLQRMLGVFDGGRMLNRATARSQLLGGMLWGAGGALLEDAPVDPRYGSFAARDLAQYLVPAHADVPEIDAIILEGVDDKANDLGAKGVGELGICGAGAAIANAVFNAVGVRVRDFPITIEKLLPGLPR
ncbi:MAG: xanthine dehydrogenase family protein molybdopterin-binding subunit [Deltaproteobacteria bacterium]|nr:xanthine dehydrogenase family protein molybdopterin-binding subunit [Deltaproteobacteria bacterium]